MLKITYSPIKGSFVDDLLAKYALLHSKKDSRVFALSADDRVKMNLHFESSRDKVESHMFIPILEFFISDHTHYADIPKEHRVASVELFLYEILKYFRNGRRSATLEAKVGEFMVHMSQTHKPKFIPHK